MAWTTLRGVAVTRWVAAAALVVLVAGVVVACSTAAQPPPTARVERSSVSVGVSASGALSSVQAQKLGFPNGGQLKELLVKVGDVVQVGQLLARLDDFAARQSLNQARAQLAQQQANLNKIVNGNSVPAARASLEQAKEILDATRSSAAATNEADDEAVDRARAEYELALRQLNQAKEACRAQYANSSPNSTSNPNPNPNPNSNAMTSSMCSTDQSAINMAQSNVAMKKTALESAESKKETDAAQGRISIANAEQAVVTAQNNLDSASINRPSDIEAQRAAVANAQVAVTKAQQDLDNTAITAPVTGTVASINGAVGEFLQGGSSITPLAPGSTAAIPGVTAVSTDQSGNAPATSAPGAGSFMVIGDVNAFEVVVPFEEADASRVKQGQQVEVTFDAIPDLMRKGTVLAVAPSGTVISGVTNYYVTVMLTETDPRLKDRQTAQANVLVQAVDNVLTVPTAAVIRRGDMTFVNVPGPGGVPMEMPFEAGLMGPDRTEVKSGLADGQEVLLPQATVTATPGNQRGGGPIR